MAEAALAARAFGPSVEARLRAAAERLLRYHFEAWFYGDSIGFEGLLAASELLADARYRDFAHGFLRGWAARDEPRRADDNTTPGLVLCQLAGDRGDVALLDAARRLATHLAARRRIKGVAVTFEDARRSLREPYGGATSSAPDREILAAPGAGVYVDCLHFDPPFYAAFASAADDPAWSRRAVEEAAGYVALLQDPEGGMFAHFWLEDQTRAFGWGWGRGQGWALLGLLDVLGLVPDRRAEVTGLEHAAERLLTSMLGSQRADGSRSAVAGVPDSGDEASTAAFMSAGFLRAIRLGHGEPVALQVASERAWSSLIDAVDGDGLLAGVSAAVYSSTVEEHYHHVPRGFDVPWGQGPLLVAALEVARASVDQA